MPYVTSIERIGMRRGLKKGLEKGREQGMRTGLTKGLRKGLKEGRARELHDAITTVLETRFGERTARVMTKALPGELIKLRGILRGLVAAKDIAAARAILRKTRRADSAKR